MATLSVQRGDRIEWKSGITGSLAASLPSNVDRRFWYYYFACANSLQANGNIGSGGDMRVYGYSLSEQTWKKLDGLSLSSGSFSYSINYGSSSLSGSSGMIHFCFAIIRLNASGGDTFDCYMGNYTSMSESIYNQMIKGRPIKCKSASSLSGMCLWGYSTGSLDDYNTSEPAGPQTVTSNPFNTSWGGLLSTRKTIMASDAYRLVASY